MEKYITSDLIMEGSVIDRMRERLGKEKKRYSEDTYGDFSVCRLTVEEKEYGYKKGRYITVYTPKLYFLDNGEQRKLSAIISRELSALIKESLAAELTSNVSVLVAGIGNRGITPDAIGPFTSEKVAVTRHVKKLDPHVFERMGSCCVSSIACGVMGETGMDTFEILKGIVAKTSPDAVIAIDALAAKEFKTLGAAIQISDTGIVPGAGVGNRQLEINSDTLGVPVIAIGVPTVVSATTLISDTLIQNGICLNEAIGDILSRGKNFFVAPKECDLLCQSAATVLSDAINSALTVI